MATGKDASELGECTDLLNLAADKARRYVQSIADRRVSPSEAALAALAELHEPFPLSPCGPTVVINRLDEIGSAATVATTGGRYFGFVNGGMVPAALAANWLAAAWNQNAALRVMSPIGAELEEVALRWVCEALGLPPECEGGLVTCATMANFTALVTARHALLARAGWDVTADGMFGAPPLDVVVGAEAHVDGAFGLWARISRKYEHLTRGFDQADSWATDAHKWPNVGYDSGLAIVRDGTALRASMGITAAYLEAGSRREPMHHTPEASRRARGVELWAALKSLGKSGLCSLIERTCAHAQRFAAGFREAGFTVLNDVVINQVLVSFGRPEVTREVIRRVQEEGTCWCGGTVWQEKTAMRISVSSRSEERRVG